MMGSAESDWQRAGEDARRATLAERLRQRDEPRRLTAALRKLHRLEQRDLGSWDAAAWALGLR